MFGKKFAIFAVRKILPHIFILSEILTVAAELTHKK